MVTTLSHYDKLARNETEKSEDHHVKPENKTMICYQLHTNHRKWSQHYFLLNVMYCYYCVCKYMPPQAHHNVHQNQVSRVGSLLPLEALGFELKYLGLCSSPI